MAFEDLFGGENAGNMTPDPSDFIGGDPIEDSGGFDFEALFEEYIFLS